MNVDLNEVLLSGTINNITDSNQDYIKFGLTTIKYDKRKVLSSLNINRNLYEIYKDFFIKGTKVFIKGYLNSYITENKIKSFITVTDIADNEDEILNGRKGPHIRIDPDGVEVWNGKREEATPMTEEELNELEELLKDYR
jgi:single-stranded DNA-binding protein